MEHMQGCAASSEWAAQGSLCLLSFIYHFISIDHCSSFSFVATAEAKCGEYCQKAVDCCPSNPEAYQMMASYLLSKGNVKVNDTDSCVCGLLLLLCGSVLCVEMSVLHYMYVEAHSYSILTTCDGGYVMYGT